MVSFVSARRIASAQSGRRKRAPLVRREGDVMIIDAILRTKGYSQPNEIRVLASGTPRGANLCVYHTMSIQRTKYPSPVDLPTGRVNDWHD